MLRAQLIAFVACGEDDVGAGDRPGPGFEFELGELLALREGWDRRGADPDLCVPWRTVGLVELAAVSAAERIAPVDLRGALRS